MESTWSQTAKIQKREPLREDKSAEVVIIGAGMAGVLIACELQSRGVDCIVLEADRIGSGQTKNTTAKITSQHALKYDQLIQQFGMDMAKQYAHANETAINAYERMITENQIDCEFQRCPAYLYSQVDKKKLEHEVEAAKQLGIQAEFTTETTLPFPVEGAVKFRAQAQFHPLKFLKAAAEGLNIYEDTKVVKVEGNKVRTEKWTVTGKHIIFATHFPFINKPGYYFSRMYQERSYVVGVSQAAQMDGMYYGIDKGGLSLRNYGDLLLVGGGQHRTGDNTEGGKYLMLQDEAKQYWKDCKVEARWSAQDCMTLDKIPYIGRFSKEIENWYVATGFGKWGMSSSMVSAHILADMITGRENQDSAIFSPQRSKTSEAVWCLVDNGVQSVKGLGKNVLHNPEKKTCPHMGCALEWNPDENAFECPCHGSRFDKDGKLLNNPAQEDLKL